MNWTKFMTAFHIQVEKKTVRQFGLILAVLVLGYFLIHGWRTGSYQAPGIIISILIATMALFIPQALYVIYIPWMVIVRILGFIIMHFLLVLIFFLIFTPLGLVKRLFGYDPLRRQRQDGSYWLIRQTKDQTNMERMF